MGNKNSIAFASSADAIVRIAKTIFQRKAKKPVDVFVRVVLEDFSNDLLVLVQDFDLQFHEWFRVSAQGVHRFDATLCEPVKGRKLSQNKEFLGNLAMSCKVSTESHQLQFVNACKSQFVEGRSG